jgi:CRP-like cAMP-binding protein
MAEWTDNLALARLPIADLALLSPHLIAIHRIQGELLFDTTDIVDDVYFPLSAMVNLLFVFEDGSAVATSSVGRTGMISEKVRSNVRAVVAIEGTVAQMPAKMLDTLVAQRAAIAEMSLQQAHALLTHTQVISACNACHSIESRVCRSLLQAADCTGSDLIPLTQQSMASTLGIRRTSVTAVASKLQTLGVIRYFRGQVQIIDHDALQRLSCLCHGVLIGLRSC